MLGKLKADLMVRLSADLPDEYLRIVSNALDRVAAGYTISAREESLVVYSGSGLPELVKKYLVCKSLEGLSSATLANYKLMLEKFFSKLMKLPEKVTTDDIRYFLFWYQSSTGISDRTLDKYRMYICGFFVWAASEEYIEKNPAAPIKPIRFEARPRQHLEQLEMEELRDCCTTLRDSAMLELMYSTGCRVSELCTLKRCDVDFEKKSVHLFGKGRKHRTSGLTSRAELLLRKYLDSRDDDGQALFVSLARPHTALTKAAVERTVRNMSKQLEQSTGKRITPHVIRHTMATAAIRAGMPVQDLQQLLGHSKIDTTMIYAHVDEAHVLDSHKHFM